MSIEGSCDADEITVTFDTPKGWDGFIINSSGEVSQKNFVNTRGEYDWTLVSNLYQFTAGNSITFPVDGEDGYATLALTLGDNAYNTTITLEYNVSKGGDEPGDDDTVFPSQFEISANVEGLTIEQGTHPWYGTPLISVEGECAKDKFELTFKVPDGWDGFVFQSASDMYKSSNSPMKKANPTFWYDLNEVLEMGYKKTNTIT